MAKPPAQPSASTAKAAGKGKVSGRVLVTAIVLLPAVAVLLPSCILLALNMVPTIVAYVVDRSREKYQSITVGLLNVCGSLPALARLWSEGQTYENALRIAADPYNMLLSYGAAAVGWSIYLTMPIVLGRYYAMTTTRRLRALRERQDILIEAWGEEIAGESPPVSD